jgi:hypothetical protein
MPPDSESCPDIGAPEYQNELFTRVLHVMVLTTTTDRFTSHQSKHASGLHSLMDPSRCQWHGMHGPKLPACLPACIYHHPSAFPCCIC